MRLYLVLFVGIIGTWACTPLSPTSAASVTRAVAPVFPAVAIQARSDGAVTVETAITPSGDVADAKVVEISGPPAVYLKEWLEQVARQWKFSSSDSRSIRTVQIKFVFRLMPPGAAPEQLGTVFSPPYQVEVRAERPSDVHLSGDGAK
jgi:TonB family protein